MFDEIKTIVRFSVLALLAAAFIQLVSCDADLKLDGFIKYDIMYESCSKNCIDELADVDEKELDLDIVYYQNQYAERIIEFRPVILQELKCMYWFLKDDDPSPLHLAPILYMEYLAFYAAEYAHKHLLYFYKKRDDSSEYETETRKQMAEDYKLVYAILVTFGANIPHDKIFFRLADSRMKMAAEKRTDLTAEQIFEENKNVEKNFQLLRDVRAQRDFNKIFKIINPFILHFFPGGEVPRFIPVILTDFRFENTISLVYKENVLLKEFSAGEQRSRLVKLIKALFIGPDEAGEIMCYQAGPSYTADEEELEGDLQVFVAPK